MTAFWLNAKQGYNVIIVLYTACANGLGYNLLQPMYKKASLEFIINPCIITWIAVPPQKSQVI